MPARLERGLGHQKGEAARLLVIFRQARQCLGLGGVLFRRRGDARAAEQHDSAFDAVFVQHQLRLEQFQLQPDGAQLVPAQEIIVREGQPIGGRTGLFVLRHAMGGFDIRMGIAERAGTVVFHRGRFLQRPAFGVSKPTPQDQ